MRYDTETLRAIVEYIDPDWTSHFAELEHAASSYQLYGGAAWDEAVYCVVGDEGEPEFSDDPLEIHRR